MISDAILVWEPLTKEIRATELYIVFYCTLLYGQFLAGPRCLDTESTGPNSQNSHLSNEHQSLCPAGLQDQLACMVNWTAPKIFGQNHGFCATPSASVSPSTSRQGLILVAFFSLDPPGGPAHIRQNPIK